MCVRHSCERYKKAKIMLTPATTNFSKKAGTTNFYLEKLELPTFILKSWHYQLFSLHFKLFQKSGPLDSQGMATAVVPLRVHHGRS